MLAFAETRDLAMLHMVAIDASNAELLVIEEEIVQGIGFSAVDVVDPAEVCAAVCLEALVAHSMASGLCFIDSCAHP